MRLHMPCKGEGHVACTLHSGLEWHIPYSWNQSVQRHRGHLTDTTTQEGSGIDGLRRGGVVGDDKHMYVGQKNYATYTKMCHGSKQNRDTTRAIAGKECHKWCVLPSLCGECCPGGLLPSLCGECIHFGLGFGTRRFGFGHHLLLQFSYGEPPHQLPKKCMHGRATKRGAKSEVAHKWAKWLPHPCSIGEPHRFRAWGKIRSGPQVGKVATSPLPYRGSPPLQSGGQNQKWPTKGQNGYLTPAVSGSPTASERGAKSEMAHKWAK